MSRQTRELREAVEYLETVVLCMLFLRQVGPDTVDAANLGTYAACERLTELPVASPAAWATLARIARHILRALDGTDDTRALLVHELHRMILTHSDRAAARGKESPTMATTMRKPDAPTTVIPSLPEAQAARAAARAEHARLVERASGRVERWEPRQEARQIVNRVGQVETIQDVTPILVSEAVSPVEQIQARRALPDVADRISLLEQQVEQAKAAQVVADRMQRAQAIASGEQVVQAELPALIAELWTVQLHMVAFAERMAQLDAPLSRRHFADAAWWIAHVAGMFKLERPG